MVAAILNLTGRVQGVGFRWWAIGEARHLRLVGHARNLPDGSVELLLQGEPERVARMLKLATEEPTTSGRPGRVADHQVRWVEPQPDATGFGQ